MLGGVGCSAGWGCLREPKVLSEVAAAVVTADSMAETVAAVVQIDADVAAPRC